MLIPLRNYQNLEVDRVRVLCMHRGIYVYSGWCQRLGPYTLYKIGGFTPDTSRNNFLHAQTMASAILFESRTTILATVQHNWQCISWLYIASTKNSMLKDTQLFRSKMGAFRCIHINATCLASCLKEVDGRLKCLLRSDWIMTQQVRQNRLENRTPCNSKSSDFHRPETFD